LLAIYKVSLILMVGLTLAYAFQGYYPEFMLFFSNVFSPLIAGVAVIVSGFCLDKYWHKARERFSIIWLFFTMGLFLWFLGESVWMGYSLILGVEIPYLSVADVFWLLGYFPFFLALYLYVRIFGAALPLKTIVIAMCATILLSVFVTIALIMPLIGVEKDLSILIVDVAYPLLDLALFSVSLLGLLIFMKGKLGKSWLLINAGILCNTSADILFGYTVAHGTYYNGHPLEVLFHFSYIFFLLAFYVHTKEL